MVPARQVTQSQLRELNLAWNYLGSSVAGALAGCLTCATSRLEILDLRDNHLGATDAVRACTPARGVLFQCLERKGR